MCEVKDEARHYGYPHMNPGEKLTYLARRCSELYEERTKRMCVINVQEQWLAEERKKSIRRDRAQFRARFSSGSSRVPPPTGPDSDFGIHQTISKT